MVRPSGDWKNGGLQHRALRPAAMAPIGHGNRLLAVGVRGCLSPLDGGFLCGSLHCQFPVLLRQLKFSRTSSPLLWPFASFLPLAFVTRPRRIRFPSWQCSLGDHQSIGGLRRSTCFVLHLAPYSKQWRSSACRVDPKKVEAEEMTLADQTWTQAPMPMVIQTRMAPNHQHRLVSYKKTCTAVSPTTVSPRLEGSWRLTDLTLQERAGAPPSRHEAFGTSTSLE